jgi:hypothetical protein
MNKGIMSNCTNQYYQLEGYKMKKTIIGILIAMMVLSVGIAFAGDYTGNDSPKAKKLYSLNIIGVDKNKNPEMSDNSGHRIFVALNNKTKIELAKGDFMVLDANGTDGEAKFQLPDPGLDAYLVGDTGGKDTMSDYSVFVRPLGTPGGWATITTCAGLANSDFAGLLPGNFIRTLNRECEWDDAFASVEQVGSTITFRDKGKSTFQNVTAALLTIVFKVEVEVEDVIQTVYLRVPIFDQSLEGEYWEYDNDGLKILQVRFYEWGTDVSDSDGSLPSL